MKIKQTVKRLQVLATAVTSFCLTGHAVGQNDDILSEQAFFEDIPVVLSASRLVQPLNEAPVAITVIDRDMIQASGVTDVAEILRFVPGFIAGHYRGHTPIAGYLFLNDSLSRRLQVMVDGRSVYAPTIGGPVWQTLPLDIEDIERIEVIRGPNAATYGSNSFLGVINIITRDPVLESGFSVTSRIGQDNLEETHLRYHGRHEDLAYRISAWTQANDGFDQRFDARRVRFFDSRFDYQLTPHDTLWFQWGLSDASDQQDEPQDSSTPDHHKSLRANYQMLKWEHRFRSGSDMLVKFYHNFDNHIEDLNLDLGPLGLVPYDQNYESQRYDLEFQITQAPTAKFELAWGGSARRDRVRSPRFLGENDPVTIRTQRIFINSAWHMDKRYLLNSGLMAERSNISSTTVSPLLAFHHHLTSESSLRITATQATRVPVAVEEFADWKINIENVGTQQFFLDTTDLDVEKITTFDVGYIHQDRIGGVTYDLKIAQHRLQNIITLDNMPFDNLQGNSTQIFIDEYDARLRTAQFSMRRNLTTNVFAYTAYAYTDIEADANIKPDERLDNAKPWHQLAAMVSGRFMDKYKTSLNVYYRDKTRGVDNTELRPSTHKVDIKLGRRIRHNNIRGEFSVVGQNITDSYESLYEPNDINPRWYLEVIIKL